MKECVYKCYAGIGSRDCPKEVLDIMFNIGKWLSNKGFVLRSGGADGCDSAFEKGCDEVGGNKEIYIPWNGFNGNSSNLIVEDERAFTIAKNFHPYWNNLKDGAKKLQARNTHQVLGKDLKSPSLFIVCYTKGGKLIGGTAQALRIANYYNIPVFNFGSYKNIEEGKKEFLNFIKRFIE